MSFEIKGKLIKKDKIQEISSSFRKREFVIEVENPQNNAWNDFVKFQLTQDRCDLIEPYNENETIKVSFNIRGRKWEKGEETSYFTNLEAWRIQKEEKQNEKSDEYAETPELSADDIPPELDDDNPDDDLPF